MTVGAPALYVNSGLTMDPSSVFRPLSTTRDRGGAAAALHLYPPEMPLVGRLQSGPAGVDARHLRQDVRLARRLLLGQRIEEGLAVLARVDGSSRGLAESAAGRLAADIETLRAIAAMFCDDFLCALHLARKVTQRSDLAEWHVEAARVVCQFAFWRLRDFEGFHALPRQQPAAQRYKLSTVVGLCIDGSIELEQLRLPVARRLALGALEEATRVCGVDSALAALPASLAAQVAYEQGALDEAEGLIRTRLGAISACGTMEAANRAYRVLARIAAHYDQLDIAESYLQEAEDLGDRRGWAALCAMSLYERARLSAARGQFDQARRCVERLESLSSRTHGRSGDARSDVQRISRMARASLSSEAGPSAPAIDALRELHDEALASRDLYSAAQLALEVAGALDRSGDNAQADQVFMRALSLGSFAGLHQVFVDAGELIAPLLARAFERAQQPGGQCRNLLPYISGLLEQKPTARSQQRARRVSASPPAAASTRAMKPAARAAEDLSARELEVLMLVCRGLSNKRVAQRLQISPETVKAYVKRIFMKLQVESRAQAVFRASGLGLLPAVDDC